MTCIVGIVLNGVTYIGGDSAGSNSGGLVTTRTDPKVFARGSYVLGYTTSFRMGDVLQFRVSAPDPKPTGITLRQHLVTTWIDQHLRFVFSKLGYLTKDKSVEEGGTFLIGYRGELCVVHDDFQVGEALEKYSAVGSGSVCALGALHALYSIQFPSGKDLVTKALEAATHHNAFVRPPYTILES